MTTVRPSITPIVDTGLGNSAYLVDLGDGRALVVDPSRDVVPYLQTAEERGLRLAYSLETHLHADFVSGSRELERLGATVLVPRAGQYAWGPQGLDDGDEQAVGDLTLRAIGTPGHTAEHLAYLLLDGRRPLGLFTGGALIVGSVARTDLSGPDQTDSLTRRLYHALHERILSLPDDLVVYPTHGAGSFCSAPGGGERTTTIGQERRWNPLLAAPDEEEFARRLIGGLGSYPAYFARLPAVNRQGPRPYGRRPPVLPRLSVEAVGAAREGGAEIIDVRPIAAFAAGHIPGTLSIAFGDSFASWLGWLVGPDRPLIFILDAAQDREALVRACLKVGYEQVAGELAEGMQAWRAEGRPEVRTTLTADPRLLPAPVLDVRQDAEFVDGHLPGAWHVELGQVPGRAATLAQGAGGVMCGHGERAMSAASLLERAGGRPTVFLGGPGAWARAIGQALVPGG